MASGDSVWQSLVAVSRHYDKPHPSMRRTTTFVVGKFFDVGRDHVADTDRRRSDEDGLRSFVSNLERSGELLSPSVEERMSWEVGSTRGDGAPPAHGEMV
ncbi:hypothetical protein QJS10_CPB18g00241 [Acorus calamus]|uniref:Uncharacterized protein n=1 Tax=Acorus calamus TaxID=4465 RepID=A0AAV9CPK1_ACOCL|nr:hypothetical protein QJS10_CPB18g00241 [Acorus calamus]